MTTIINGVSTKTVQGHFLFSPVLWKAIKRPSPTDIFPKQMWLLSQNKKILSSTKAVMKRREQISIVCYMTLFKPKSFHLSHWGFQGQPQLVIILSVLHSNITNLISHLHFVQQNTQVTLSEWVYFQIPPCNAETTQETRRNIKADSITLCDHEPGPMAEQPRSQPWHRISRASTQNQIHSVWYSKSWHQEK